MGMKIGAMRNQLSPATSYRRTPGYRGPWKGHATGADWGTGQEACPTGQKQPLTDSRIQGRFSRVLLPPEEFGIAAADVVGVERGGVPGLARAIGFKGA